MKQSDSRRKLLQSFLRSPVHRADAFYVPGKERLRFVKRCHEHDLAVVRIEALIAEDGGLRPLLDWIADYLSPPQEWTGHSWQDIRDACNKAAGEFLQKAPDHPGVVFDFVVLAEDDLPSASVVSKL